MQHQMAAVDSGQWLLYRFDPRRAAAGESPLQLDSPAPKIKFLDYAKSEGRFKSLARSPEENYTVSEQAQHDIDTRRALFMHLAGSKAR